MFDEYLELISMERVTTDDGYDDVTEGRCGVFAKLKNRILEDNGDEARRFNREVAVLLINPEDYHGQEEADYNGKRFVISRYYSTVGSLLEIRLVEK